MLNGDPKHNWTEFFQAFRCRPGMYLGRKSISGFALFMCGFQFAETIYKIENPVTDDDTCFDWRGFEAYVAKKYNKKSMSVHSFTVALMRADNDEEKGFDLWFEWYDEFLALKAKPKKGKK